MEEDVEDDPGGFGGFRDSMSRAARLADSVQVMLNSDQWKEVSGSHSGLRVYSLELCGLILRMVDRSQCSGADEFDIIRLVVASAADELSEVVNELLS